MTPEEAERLRRHVETGEAWKEEERLEQERRSEPFAEVLKPIWQRMTTPAVTTPSGNGYGDQSTARDHRLSSRIYQWVNYRMRPWYEAHPRPEPFDKPADIIDEAGLTMWMLQRNEETFISPPNEDDAPWRRQYRALLGPGAGVHPAGAEHHDRPAAAAVRRPAGGAGGRAAVVPGGGGGDGGGAK